MKTFATLICWMAMISAPLLAQTAMGRGIEAEMRRPQVPKICQDYFSRHFKKEAERVVRSERNEQILALRMADLMSEYRDQIAKDKQLSPEARKRIEDCLNEFKTRLVAKGLMPPDPEPEKPAPQPQTQPSTLAGDPTTIAFPPPFSGKPANEPPTTPAPKTESQPGAVPGTLGPSTTAKPSTPPNRPTTGGTGGRPPAPTTDATPAKPTTGGGLEEAGRKTTAGVGKILEGVLETILKYGGSIIATGRTTGHIADITMTNPDPQSVVIQVPEFSILRDANQGFVIPDPTPVTIPGNTTTTVPVYGYCTDPHLPAPSPGAILPSPDQWVTTSPLIPQTKSIINATESLLRTKRINTPLDPSLQDTRDILTQYTLWTIVPDQPIKPEDLCERIRSDIETTTGKTITSMTPTVRQTIDYGVLQIKDAITHIGREAGLPSYILPSLPPGASHINDAAPPSHPEIGNTIQIVSTGRTTGHIIDITLDNLTTTPVMIYIGEGSLYIHNGKDQPMIVPPIPPIPLEPGQRKTIPVTGYCADIRIPPVPDGGGMPSPREWIGSGPSGTTALPEAPPGYEIVTIPTRTAWPLPRVISTLQDLHAPPHGTGHAPCPEGTLSPFPLLPGTDIQLRTPIVPETAPGIGVPLLLSALDEITTHYDYLWKRGEIQTPFSGNPDKEREAVIQQTFWMYSSSLRGYLYEKEDFKKQTLTQFEKTTGRSPSQLPEPEKEKLDAGVDDFWNSFTAVGVEAKVLPNVPVMPSVLTEPIPSPLISTNLKPQTPMSGSHDPSGVFDSGIDLPPMIPEFQVREEQDCDCGHVHFDVAPTIGENKKGPKVLMKSIDLPGNPPVTALTSPEVAETGDEIKLDLSGLKVSCGKCNGKNCDVAKISITVSYSNGGQPVASPVSLSGSSGSFSARMPDRSGDVPFTITVRYECHNPNCGKINCEKTFTYTVRRKQSCECGETYLTVTVKHKPANRSVKEKEETFTFEKYDAGWELAVMEGDEINVTLNPKSGSTISATCGGCDNACVATGFTYKITGANISKLESQPDKAKPKDYDPTGSSSARLVDRGKVTGGNGDVKVMIITSHTCVNAGCNPAKDCEKTFTLTFRRR